MNEDIVLGVVAGGGWGVFLGFFIGVTWVRSFIKELADDDEEGDPGA